MALKLLMWIILQASYLNHRDLKTKNNTSAKFDSYLGGFEELASSKRYSSMDPRYTGEILKHLEKQSESLAEVHREMSHELHKLQVEEEMMMRKFYELMTAQGLNKKNKVADDGSAGQTTTVIAATSEDLQ